MRGDLGSKRAPVSGMGLGLRSPGLSGSLLRAALDKAAADEQYRPRYLHLSTLDPSNPMYRMIFVRAGGDFTCAIHEGSPSAVKCWGSNLVGPRPPRPRSSSLKSIRETHVQPHVPEMPENIADTCLVAPRSRFPGQLSARLPCLLPREASPRGPPGPRPRARGRTRPPRNSQGRDPATAEGCLCFAGWRPRQRGRRKARGPPHGHGGEHPRCPLG